MTDRHEKWVKVEPGHVIPAGQPYACKYRGDTGLQWGEFVPAEDTTAWDSSVIAEWFVDSSWKPPLVLPTEPTWGIAVHNTKRRDRTQTVARVVPVGSTAPVAEALAQAVEHHINNGGRVEDVIGFQEWAHPCGGVHINLVLASDAVTEAQQILRAGGSA